MVYCDRRGNQQRGVQSLVPLAPCLHPPSFGVGRDRGMGYCLRNAWPQHSTDRARRRQVQRLQEELEDKSRESPSAKQALSRIRPGARGDYTMIHSW